jgi:polyribonucleotide nucleotidyltransferase
MASVCATSLALMDAGVPIKEPVCGVAMGIFADTDESRENITSYRILTDISGLEDYMGDMDFKVAGTLEGITSLQVSLKYFQVVKFLIHLNFELYYSQADFKIHGLPINLIKETLEKSKGIFLNQFMKVQQSLYI